jgi:hypothetical protein
MAIIRGGIISRASSGIFKGGVSEKTNLAKMAGSGGLSARQMDKKLKDSGYDPQRRREMIGKITDKGSGGIPAGMREKNLKFALAQKVAGERGIDEASRTKIIGSARGGVKGTATNLGIKTVQTGFAGSLKK